MQGAEGVLGNEEVIVSIEAEASRLYNKGHFGVPESGGSLRLHLLEAIFLVEKERLTIVSPSGAEVDLGEVLSRAVKAVPSFEVRYSVYQDLRERGYIIVSPLLLGRSDGTSPEWDLEVFSRGVQGASRSRPDIRAFSISERSPLALGPLIEKVRAASKGPHRVLIAIVDEEGDVTYYEVETSEPSGSAPTTPAGEYEGHLLEDRVVITGKGSHSLHEDGYFGKPTSNSLQLSFLEAAYLMDKGVLTIKSVRTGKKVSHKDLVRAARERQGEFDQRLRAYSDLRDKGLVVKTGFKYGTHFRVYKGDPSGTHAQYLMHAIPEDFESTWPELSRAVRLAHGVRKEILFSRTLPKAIEYIQFKRVRP